jgi:hypothetical protein
MRKFWMLALAASAFASRAEAADCDAITSGKVALNGHWSQLTLPNLEPKISTFVLEPGPNPKFTQTRPDGGEMVVEYADGHLAATTDLKTGAHVTFVWSEVEGDSHSLQEGNSFHYVNTILKDGVSQYSERVVRSIGAHATRTVSGCAIDTVRLRETGDRVSGEMHRETQSDFAPALGISVWSETTIRPNANQNPITFRTMISALEQKP